MRKACILLSAAAMLLAVAAFAVLCIQSFSFDSQFYSDQYDKHNTASYVGAERADVNAATVLLLDYLRDKRQNLNFRANVGGQEREYYNDREKAHMVDVKNLYQKAVLFAVYCAAVAAVLFALCFLIFRKKALLPVLKGIYKAGMAVLAFFAVLLAWAAADFNGFWTTFHRVFFRNGLWLLDPSTSLMIRMFESGFFFDLVLLILLLFFGVVIPATVAAKIFHKRLAAHAG